MFARIFVIIIKFSGTNIASINQSNMMSFRTLNKKKNGFGKGGGRASFPINAVTLAYTFVICMIMRQTSASDGIEIEESKSALNEEVAATAAA